MRLLYQHLVIVQLKLDLIDLDFFHVNHFD